MKNTILLAATLLSVNLAHADDSIKVCAPGQQKAMLSYESTDDNVISFGNIFVCTPAPLNTEAAMTELRAGLKSIHKNAVIVSVIPLAS